MVNINKAARPVFDQPLSTKASALGERDMEKFHNIRKFGDDKNVVSKNAIGVRGCGKRGGSGQPYLCNQQGAPHKCRRPLEIGL